MYRSPLAAILLLACYVRAQNTTVQIFGLQFDSQTLLGSVVSAAPSATVLAVNCPADQDSSDCSIAGTATVTQGPSMFEFATSTMDFSASIHCDLAGTTSAVCMAAFGGSDANFPGTSTETVTGTDLSYVPVTVTAGAEKLGSVAAAVTAATTAATTGSSAVGASSQAPSTASATASSASNASDVSSAASSAAASRSTSAVSGAASSGSATRSAASQTSSGAVVQASTAAGVSNKQVTMHVAGLAGVFVAAFAL